MAQALAQVGDREVLQRALAAAEGIGDERWRAEALSDVAQALAQVGERERPAGLAAGAGGGEASATSGVVRRR